MTSAYILLKSLPYPTQPSQEVAGLLSHGPPAFPPPAMGKSLNCREQAVQACPGLRMCSQPLSTPVRPTASSILLVLTEALPAPSLFLRNPTLLSYKLGEELELASREKELSL